MNINTTMIYKPLNEFVLILDIKIIVIEEQKKFYLLNTARANIFS